MALVRNQITVWVEKGQEKRAEQVFWRCATVLRAAKIPGLDLDLNLGDWDEEEEDE